MKKFTYSTAARRGATLAAVTMAGVALSASAANAAVPSTTSSTVWDSLAQCESSGNWGINNGNGYAGGLQFSPSTWAAYGGTGSAANASREQQIAVAERVQAGQGWGAWPACAAKLGLSGGAVAPQSAPQAQAPAPAKATAKAPVRSVAPKAAAPAPAAKAVAPAKAAPRHAAPVALSGESYTVQSGDTLSKVAEKLNIAGGWQLLADANASTVSDPDLVFPGQVLQLPA
ncbi:LysM peptidoglycan-binding domain-containing protein [Pseudarthrobacter sp. 1C304]|uniref:LysM peptidoglycan-binding domain-containing protein n=1 Tax=Pseudarthrobacter sp. 1C304 TaxID=3457438 RepID=UPI003FD34062